MKKKHHNLTAEEQKQWKEEKKCHICKEKFLKDSSKPQISKELKQLLEANKLDCAKIPSIKKVKKQKRIMSLQLHPDKLFNATEQEKHIKQEELKKFNVKNDELLEYLHKHEMFMNDEDELTEEEIERIKKKGNKIIDHDHWTGKYRGAAH